MVMGAVQGAQAADLPEFLADTPLRGGLSTISRNWEGYYVGGQAGYTSATVDFSTAQASMVNFLLRNSVEQSLVQGWTLFGKNHVQGTSFGAFAGRNFQWDDVVLGVEMTYNYMSGIGSTVTNSMGRQMSNPSGTTPPAGHTYTYAMGLTGASSLTLHDVMTFRGRAGWSTGNFLPYAFGGLAVGRMDVSRSVAVSETLYDSYTVQQVVGGVVVNVPVTDTTVYPVLSSTETRRNAFVAGYTAGLGTEVALFDNMFLRAEWEYIKFLKVKDIAVATNSARLGLGYKF